MRLFFSFFLFISLAGAAQCKEYIIGVKGDTLNCVDVKGKKQGRWVLKVESLRGEPGYEEEGVFVNNLKEGLWRRYSLMGDLIALENYRWGNKNGQNIYYDNMGNLVREEGWKAVNPDNPYDTVEVYDIIDPTKVVDRVVMKLEGYSLKHGTWKMYDPISGTAKTERWWLDKPASQANGGNMDDELSPIDISGAAKSKSDTAAKKTYPKPQAILDYEKKNSGKKKVKVRDGRTGY